MSKALDSENKDETSALLLSELYECMPSLTFRNCAAEPETPIRPVVYTW